MSCSKIVNISHSLVFIRLPEEMSLYGRTPLQIWIAMWVQTLHLVTKQCFVYETLPTLRGWGGCGCARPVAEAAQIPQPLTTPASYRHAHTHTRVRAGTGAPGGRGAREGGESVHLPKTMPAPSQEKCVTARQQWGAQRCQVPPAPCPSAAPQAQPPRRSTERPGCPASSCSPLKTKCLLSVNHSPPRGTADLRSCDGGMWLRRVL